MMMMEMDDDDRNVWWFCDWKNSLENFLTYKCKKCFSWNVFNIKVYMEKVPQMGIPFIYFEEISSSNFFYKSLIKVELQK